jgi:hypothetical protein
LDESLAILGVPNDQDQLPGRLIDDQTPKSKNAGPVNCIRSFALLSSMM